MCYDCSKKGHKIEDCGIRKMRKKGKAKKAVD